MRDFTFRRYFCSPSDVDSLEGAASSRRSVFSVERSPEELRALSAAPCRLGTDYEATGAGADTSLRAGCEERGEE